MAPLAICRESALRTFWDGVRCSDRRFFLGGECCSIGKREGGSSGIWVVSNETQTATRHACNWSAASPIRWRAAGVGSWQRKTSACASLLSPGGTVAGESVRMYWRIEAISIDVSQVCWSSATASAPIKRTQGALRLAARLGLVALRALCGSRLCAAAAML